MKTIYKYTVPIIPNPRIDLPKGAEILSFKSQNGVPVIWALVDPSEPEEAREFAVYGTGQRIAEDVKNLKYIGTTQESEMPPLVWHLFEVIGK